jgi:nicotinamidase-related amidase
MTILFPAGGLPKGPKVDVQKALLLIDLQNDFVTPEGKLPVPTISAFLPNLPSLASKFRTKGSIIWVRTEFAQPRLTVSGETGLPAVLLRQHLEAGNTDGTYQVC